MALEREPVAADVLDLVGEQVFVIDEEYTVRYANESAAEAAGRSVDDVIGEPCYGVTHDREVPCGEGDAPCPIDRVVEMGEPTTVEHVHTGEDDEERIVEITAYPYELDGEPHVIEILSDVTERRQHRRALLERRAASVLLRDVYRSISKVETRAELERRVCEHLTDEFFEVAWIGYLDEENRVITPRTWLGPDDYVEDVEIDMDDPETGRGPGGIAVRTNSVTYTQDVATDERFEPWRDEALERGFHSFAAIPIQDEAQSVQGMIGLYATETDVFTDPLLEALREFHETLPIAIWAIDSTRRALRLSEAVENAGHAVYITDADGVIEYVNPAFERITGYSAAEVVGEPPTILSSGEMSDAYYDDLWETVTAGDTWVEEVINRKRSGSLYTASQTIAPIEADGEIQGYVAIQNDITQQRIREQQLEVLHRVLRHNVRNDTNVIKGYAQLLKGDHGHVDRTDAIEAIIDSATELERLSKKAATVEGILEEYIGASGSVYLADLVTELGDTIADQFPQAAVDCGEVPSVYVDQLIGPALEELLVNAIEHNDIVDPRVDLSASVDEASGMVSIVVIDNGPPIPDDDKQALVEGTETALRHGSGIGLWMVYWIVNLTGGDVAIRELDPRGTAIRIHSPVQDPQTDDRSESADSRSA